MKVQAVIGANYGDEGKGHIVDYLSGPDMLVVRHNGGAQAGHTVVTPDGRRHVFHHFGSGSLRSAKTFLSRFFLVNPIVYIDELVELQQVVPRPPVVYVDPRAMVTTPYDMMLNRSAEEERAASRHGSCGMGINETVHRCTEHKAFALHVLDLLRPDLLETRLSRIRDEYVPLRKAQLRLSKLPQALRSKAVFEEFLVSCDVFRRQVLVEEWGKSSILARYEHRVFEGAQGLRLDEVLGRFPHVTRSRTGITNVLTMMKEAMITDPLDVWYVTRPYITRHGAGPLKFEMVEPPIPHLFKDETNVPNPYQGTLRFGAMDYDEMLEPIYKDLEQGLRSGLRVRPHLAVTCVDHMDDAKAGNWAVHEVSKRLYLHGRIICDGPTRENCFEETYDAEEAA